MRIGRVTWALTALGLVGCEASTTDPAPAVPQTSIVPAPATERPAELVDYNERLARIADALPGFGGFFREDGRLVVLMKENSSSVEDVKSVIGAYRYETGIRPELAERRRSDVNSMVVRTAEYDFRELFDWYGQLQRPVWAVEGVSWTDIDERLNRIEIGASDQTAVDEVLDALSSLDVPEEAVRVVLDPSVYTPDFADLQDAVSPRRGGMQVSIGGLSSACSLGFHVDRPQDGYWYFLTASHCTDDYASTDGEYIGQPLIADTIGYEVYDPPTFTNSTDTLCSAGYDCRRSDAALFRHTSWDFLHGYVAWPNIGDTEFSVATQVLIGYDAEVGDTVQLVGRTSGRQKGVVTDTCVKLAGAPSAGYQYLCSWEADYTSSGGDSGGAVVWVDPLDSDYKVAVGIHSGSTSGGARIFTATSQWKYEMQQEYGGSYCEDRFCAPDPVVSIVDGPTVVPNTFMYCEWNASSTQGIPPFTYTWSGVASGSGSQLNASVSGSGYLTVEVEDGNGNTDTDSIYITIDGGADPPECSW